MFRIKENCLADISKQVPTCRCIIVWKKNWDAWRQEIEAFLKSNVETQGYILCERMWTRNQVVVAEKG
jgi:hypothetical protein